MCTLLLVASKIALASAGAIGASYGSPMAPGLFVFDLMRAVRTLGIAGMRSIAIMRDACTIALKALTEKLRNVRSGIVSVGAEVPTERKCFKPL